MDIEAYIETEHECLGDWPKKPYTQFGNRQYFTLAKELVENVRNRSIRNGIKPEDYGNEITECREIFDDLRTWLNYEDNMTERQKEEFGEQTFWLHKEGSQGGLLDKKQDIWPISRDDLIPPTKRYLQTPLMWSDKLDYLLTDAFIYIEVSAYRESLLTKERFPEIYGTNWEPFFKVAIFLIKWVAISSALVISYQESRDVFLLIGLAVIAYQSVKAVKATTANKEWDLYLEMVSLYQHCSHKHYNASVIWDMCKKVRDRGAVFDSIMYDLLEKQIKNSYQQL